MKIFWLHIKTCISKYASFGGYATRSEFWHWALFVAIITAILSEAASTLLFVHMSGGPDTADNPLNWLGPIFFVVLILLGLFLLFCLLPTLAVIVRRLRDAGYQPWIIVFPVLLLLGAIHPALVLTLSNMDSTPPEIPLIYCHAYLSLTAAVCVLYLVFLSRPHEKQTGAV